MSTPKIYAAINAVADALSKIGIAKDQENTHQRFKFRGIDDVYGALARPLVDAGVRIFPRVISRETTERGTAKGGIAFATVLTVEYDFVAVSDGSKHTACVVGEAADSGDKGHSKALSMAFKYACFQTFCIPVVGEEDADSTTHELKPVQKTAPPEKAAPVLRGNKSEEDDAAHYDQGEPPPKAPVQEKAKHPVLMQLEQALSKYGEEKREFYSGEVAKKMGVKTIFDIPQAQLPQALMAVMQHQKEARAAKAAKAAADKPAAKKAPAKVKPPLAAPDKASPLEQQYDDSTDDGDLPV